MERHTHLAFDLIKDIQLNGTMRPDFLAQALLVLSSFLLALWVSRRFKSKLGLEEVRWQWGRAGFLHICFPLAVLLVLFLGRWGLHRIFSTPLYLVSIAQVLSLALLNIQALLYLLFTAFNQADWIKKKQQWITGSVWVLYVAFIFGILPDLANALDAVHLDFGKTRISILWVLQGLVLVVATLLIALWAARLAERRLMATSVVDVNIRVVLVKIVQTMLVVLAVIISFPLVGIDLTVLSVFGGALGVGLGFGLQKIASNYLSGFIILLDRSIKIGDLITVDGRTGTVLALTARYVILQALDGTTSLVPNDTFVTSTVVNQSYSDPYVWVKLPVCVDYASDLDLVMRLLLEATQGQPRILNDPPPKVYIDSFGSSAVQMALGFWLKDPGNGTAALRSELNQKIWRAFRQHKISIPFDRLDVTLFRSRDHYANSGNLEGIV